MDYVYVLELEGVVRIFSSAKKAAQAFIDEYGDGEKVLVHNTEAHYVSLRQELIDVKAVNRKLLAGKIVLDADSSAGVYVEKVE